MDFSDQDVPYPCLEIVENKQHSRAKVLTFKVHPLVIGTFPLVRKTLETSHHPPEWSSIETKDVTDNFSDNVTTEKVLLLKSSTHRNVIVTTSPSHDENLSSWCVPSLAFGEVRYTSGYWEWVEYVLARCKETLDNIKTYDAIFASMFTYNYNKNVLQAFCENCLPSTNTVSTFVGELPISLWDLRTIRGLLVHGSFYDEVIPLAKELTHADDQGKSFLQRSCSFLFRRSTDLPKVPLTKSPFENGQSFGLWG
ncbi:hypothetical protein R3W88_016455 [Solanum pinnatisectum]|uniref:Uncharacterized protein n=1 Tax=Solanum pinnatisectum TaxID=50273 RepID=A0AAV9KXF7_9SOLN|nr:hypothetical protein R3W88_016455 [Solanum pinnatisectum]